ncbi:non-homologous end-joining DNA ligase [Natranaerobius thermophilus]|uniref:non-homologous end-joining DNA ligase n=2 Tax=Natranaerobius thermophilus TaxID=375929 RepID=UPI00130DA6DF|nr:non-homologous end-joining DNA ligase [Natranaerobius thermophilus]
MNLRYMVNSQTLDVHGREVVLTNLLKPIWPEKDITKYDLIKYFLDMSPYILPHLKNRPLVITRFPEGVHKEGFYQKDIKKAGNSPSWLKTITIPTKNKERERQVIDYLVVDHPATLVWLGNLAAVELHPWLSSVESLDYPDFGVFDLDPMPQADFYQVKTLAFSIKKILNQLEITGYPKLTGSSGLQIFVPFYPKYTYQEIREFIHKVCLQVLDHHADIATIERKVNQRPSHKVYLDYLQNAKGKTISAIYGPRANKGAHVSVPVNWEELANIETSRQYDVLSVGARMKNTGDVFKTILENKQKLNFC